MRSNKADWILIAGIWFIGFAQIWITLGNREVTRVNQTYNRATVCFLAVPPMERTEDYIEHCYEQAESATGKTIERFREAK
jgi:hypothetical protein